MVVRKHQRTALAEINVTPLVDVMLVLLIIFMITAPMLQQQMDVTLPATANAPQMTAAEPVMLTVTKQGNLYLNQTAYTLEALRPQLQSLYAGRQEREIFLRADTEVPYGTVVKVMDELKRVGIFKLGMVTQPVNERR
jgi:biopolymer transport protein TolR